MRVIKKCHKLKMFFICGQWLKVHSSLNYFEWKSWDSNLQCNLFPVVGSCKTKKQFFRTIYLLRLALFSPFHSLDCSAALKWVRENCFLLESFWFDVPLKWFEKKNPSFINLLGCPASVLLITGEVCVYDNYTCWGLRPQWLWVGFGARTKIS